MANTDPVSIQVFSLNCWGIHYISKHVPQRFAIIGDMLCKEKHDIVLLQEVWSEKDYLHLKKTLARSHPHSHYFKSGVVGSGLAIFTKYRIHDTLLYRYSLNGYPYMIHHGDWFGGKAVGMAVLNIGSLTANVYVTHLHAEYSRDNDLYLPHRVVQSWELQQFICHTSVGADVVILGGDLNMHPQDLGNRLLWTATGLRDSYSETAEFDGCEDGVTVIPDNCYVREKDLLPFEKGIRIDYILFKGSSKVDIYCDFMSTTKGCAPGYQYPYSDHEALTVTLRLEMHTPTETDNDRKSKAQDSSAGRVAELINIVTEARTLVKVGLHFAERKRDMDTRTAVMGLALLIVELAFAAGHLLGLAGDLFSKCNPFYLLTAFCLTTLLTTALLVIFYTMELKSLQGTEDQMRLFVGSQLVKLWGFPLAQLHQAERRLSKEPSASDPEE